MALLTSYWTIYLVLGFLSVLVAAYLYMTRNFHYWMKRGVLEIPPLPFVGNFGSCCLFKRSVAEYLKLLYERGKGLPYIGFYLFDKPILVLRDPDLIRNVLTKDNNYFLDRYASSVESDVLGYQNLFFLKNPAWKNLRQKLTPLFSSGKIRGMFPLVTAIGDDLVTHFESLVLEGDGQIIELKEICAKYTTDIIGTCSFGLQVNSLSNPNAEFRKRGRAIFEGTYKRGLELLSVFFIPGIVKPFGFTVFGTSTSKFIKKIFWETFNERLRSGVRRHDLIDLLMDLKNSQTHTDDPYAFEFDGDNLVAQAAVFFAAGFETSSALISFTLHELSLHPDIQAKLRHEITTAQEKNGKDLSYEMVKQLPYLDKVIWESLRKYPSLPFLDRVASHDYTVPKTGLVIEKGTPVYIPMLGLHYDPEYFPDPEKYDPERFNEENKRKQAPYVYLPFGGGPRNCIGVRFGLMQAKIGIIKVVSNYELMPCERTLNPMRFDPKALIGAAEGGLYHRIRRIETKVS